MIMVGDKAPDFHLPASGGKTVSLRDYKGKKIILYFYPKDMTSGCTKEACAFQEALPALSRRKTVVIGVSADSAVSHDKFSQKNKLRFMLASDGQKETAKAYGVWKEKSMYGRKYFGIERTTFILDEDGVVRYIFPKVKVDGHVQELLKVL
jgi:thioredoxin-dependent peroxiredoxin